MNANVAYSRSIFGKGVTIAIIDTGIAVDNREFVGRISPDSKVIPNQIARCGTCAGESQSFDLNDVIGHGTETASVAAAAANGVGSQGVAPDATILAIKISAPDLTGVTPTSIIRESDSANPSSIAPAIKYAVDRGAFVISMSLNGQSSGKVAAEQRAAMDYVRSNNRLLIESVDNGVGVNSFAGTIAENLVGADLTNKDWFLFGIRLDARLQPPSGNGNPGILADRTLAVVATDILVANKDGGTTTVTGNSFAAPAIAGAAALLKQNWPQLGGKEISRILLDTAKDLGAPGPDPVYGAGVLDVENALKAQVPSVVTAQGSAAFAGSALHFSSAFGPASVASINRAVASLVVLDRYGRDYQAHLNGAASFDSLSATNIQIAGILRPTPSAWTPIALNQSSALRTMFDDSGLVGGHVAIPRKSGRFGFSLSDETQVSGQIDGSIDQTSLASGAVLSSIGIATSGADISFSRRGWTVAVVGGESRRSARSLDRDSSYRGFRMILPNGLILGLASNEERGSALGLRGEGAFAIAGSTTTLLTLGWTGDVRRTRLTAEAVGGATSVRDHSPLLRFEGPILSSGLRLQADTPILGGVGTVGFTAPLRVNRARARLTVPTSYDWRTGAVTSDVRLLDLSPSGRPMNLELGWARAVTSRGWLRLGLAHQVAVGAPSRRGTAGFAVFTIR